MLCFYCCLYVLGLMGLFIGSDEVCVPFAAGFENAALAGVVDIDDTEALAIAFRPLKIVDQRPDKIAFQGRTLLQCAGYGLDMLPQVRGAAWVAHDLFLAIPVIGESGTVFRNVERRHGVFAVQTHQQIGESLWINLPAHLGIASTGHRRDDIAGVEWCRGITPANDGARIVVDAQEINRCTDNCHIALLHLRWIELHTGKEEIGIAASVEWIEKPAIGESVGNLQVMLRFRAVIRRVERVKVERNADRGARLAGGAQTWHGQSMREQQVMAHLDGGLPVFQARGMDTDAVAQEGRAPGFIMCDPSGHAVAQALRHDLSIVGESLHGITILPAALILQGLGQIPVIEGDERLNAMSEQSVYQAIIEIQPLLIDRTCSSGLDAWPGN